MTALLDAGRVDAYLARLGSPEVRHDAGGLATLQSAHLRAVPFHNLGLLANDGRPYTLQALEAVVDEAIAGIGGNCDRTTPPFATLLQSVGFDAHLVAATVRAPGDHFVCVVHIGGRRYLCDVGNGHPYLRPWDLDGPRQAQSFNGWHFEFDPRAAGGPTLMRRLDDGDLRTVYVVDPAPRAYGDFAPMVNAHYSQAGFGPFLDGLRAVSIGADAVLTLRDAEYARHTRFGRFVRRVHGRDAIAGLLIQRFGLRPALVDAALSVVARRRPDLLGDEPPWVGLSRGCIAKEPSLPATLSAPPRASVPDILVSLATVGRTAAVERLLRTLATEVEASGYPGRVGVLIVENHDHPHQPASVPPGLPVHRVPIRDLTGDLERSTQIGLMPRLNHLPAPIGVAREAQVHTLRRHLD
ncbi:MAG: arylamine N-acetyltransferase, partial [Myxococcales bacterium]|nr:arylamine N-acetyltransferase [Myxococcales bacterium]